MPSAIFKRTLAASSFLWLLCLVIAASVIIWLMLKTDDGMKPHRNWLTTNSIAEAAFALEIFRAAEGHYPLGSDWISVTPKLEKYWAGVSRTDAWMKPLVYKASNDGYWLASCGADKICSDMHTGRWCSGDYDQDIVMSGGQWVQVRGLESHADVSVEASGAIRQESAGVVVLDLVATVVSDQESPSGIRLEAYILGSAEWSGETARLVETRGGREYVALEVPVVDAEKATELLLEATISEPPVCFLVVVRDRQRRELDYRNNVDSWCF